MASMGTMAGTRTTNSGDPSQSVLGANAPLATGKYAGLTPQQMTSGGYQWDIGQQQYTKNPAYAGNQAGQYVNGYLGAVPSLNGLVSGAAGAAGGGAGVPGMGGTGTGGTGSSGGGGVGAGAAAPQSLQMPDQSAATTAAFARAKDQAGQLTRSSLDSLAGELGGQGMLGSGAQYQGTADILTKGTNLLGEESRDEAMKSSDLAADFAKTGYAGGITQRGQDMAQQTAYRGQDVAAQDAQARLALESRQQVMSMLSLALRGLSPTQMAY